MARAAALYRARTRKLVPHLRGISGLIRKLAGCTFCQRVTTRIGLPLTPGACAAGLVRCSEWDSFCAAVSARLVFQVDLHQLEPIQDNLRDSSENGYPELRMNRSQGCRRDGRQTIEAKRRIFPTIWPWLLMPAASVALLPGTSRVVKLPPLRRNP